MKAFKSIKSIAILVYSFAFSCAYGVDAPLKDLLLNSPSVFTAKYSKSLKDGYFIYKITARLKGEANPEFFEWPSSLVIGKGPILVFSSDNKETVFQIHEEHKIYFFTEENGKSKIVEMTIEEIHLIIKNLAKKKSSGVKKHDNFSEK